MSITLSAGAAVANISPKDSQFLFGYPHVERYSTGVHDPLLTSALYLSDGFTEVMFIANDIIFIPKAAAMRVRRRIERATSIPASNIMVTATHTHSGPMTVDCLSNEADPAVPQTDPEYVRLMEDAIVEAAATARNRTETAQLGLAVAREAGIGTNRRDPSGPADPEVPVLVVRSVDGRRNIAAMVVCSMHPTVLHEDSTLVSGDFPAATRQYLQQNPLGPDCPLLYHTGPCGNQSTRHVVKANTFAEAERLGVTLGKAIEKVLPHIPFTSGARLRCYRDFLDLPGRSFPPVQEAEQRLRQAQERFKQLRRSGAPRQEVRTAECDWFGAEEGLTLAKASRDGRLATAYALCLPAEVQIIQIGPWVFVGWPGEVFVEYSLKLKANSEDTFVISLANGELQGYIVTPEAAAEGGYEASNALFGPESGKTLVDKTLEMLTQC